MEMARESIDCDNLTVTSAVLSETTVMMWGNLLKSVVPTDNVWTPPVPSGFFMPLSLGNLPEDLSDFIPTGT